MRSRLAIVREVRRIEARLTRERRRWDRVVLKGEGYGSAGAEIASHSVRYCEAARQALAWALRDHAAAPMKCLPSEATPTKPRRPEEG